MLNFEEINKLKTLLENENIPFMYEKIFDGYSIICPDYDNRICDAVIHSYSYGHKTGLLEFMGTSSSDVEGYLTADECLKRFRKCYMKVNND